MTDPIGPDWLTTSQAAELLHITARSVRRRCQAGKLKARLVTTEKGEEWQIRADSIHADGPDADASDDRGRPGTGTTGDTQSSTKEPTGDSYADAGDGSDKVRTTEDADASDGENTKVARLEGFMLSTLMEQAVTKAVEQATAPLIEQNRQLLARLESIEERLRQSTLPVPPTPPTPGAPQQAGSTRTVEITRTTTSGPQIKPETRGDALQKIRDGLRVLLGLNR